MAERNTARLLKQQLPDYTCPHIDKIRAALEAHGYSDLVAELERVRLDNVQLRYVAKTALRELKKKEDVLRELAKHLPPDAK